MCQTAIYPGTFDPVTYGHIDLIKRAQEIFPEVIVAVAHSQHKNPFFSVQERVMMLKKATQELRGIEIVEFDGLVVDYARKHKVKVLIRGLRMLSDFEYEFQMALTNRKLSPDIETIFLMPHESYSYLSSKLLKEAASLGADLSNFVPDFVGKALKEKLSSTVFP
ncbi:MAG: pantetheine-phosphate adenylyltransferase [Candidatus Omnitrophica bacterium CG08_land_8_20_14_0_20_41_16]|uniref:Phosphopantetheine adenylyltransferase n=1 Tax=Candidatus Sherwoodlollariibacterium unditelluris TaxID=1974757 RepID=A0A2G9YJC1_9BACT|nr:MAG: pantetheine-phosphate adenylyltransferase [Candidatus Omnitrophica bacterium CG23_combo_of_CG06-09_8_20_14_all_41_10]PIS33692.1 MAG: pantetheine-phosphate adenylyltransferase [Candidatus Omnitrophica bacterium CG08_land_8_20_14_0_20_41_16]